MTGFLNGVFLVFIAFFILSEAVERIFEPLEVHHERLFLISVIGFFVNLVGIFVFNHGGDHGHSHGGSGCSHGHSHGGGDSDKSPLINSNGNSLSIQIDHGHSHDGSEGHNHSHSHSHSNSSANSGVSGGESKIFEGIFLHILADTLGEFYFSKVFFFNLFFFHFF
jgi:solute carrier family 30 (zinc transporter), member 5/7